MIDTVTEKDIDRLCDHCVLAIQFDIANYEGKERVIDVAVFMPDFKLHKFNVLNGQYTITAYKSYFGPKVLICPACHFETDNPLIWCETLVPDF